jgi:hypothetical protein
MYSRYIICAVCAVLVFAFVPVSKASGQAAESLAQVKKVFVDSLGGENGATELRDAIIKALHKDSDIQIVATASEADAVITGIGKIWVTGAVRLGPHGSVSQPTYDGYLQAELKGRGDKTLWSQHVTPSSFPWNGIVWDLASHFVKNLLAVLRQNKHDSYVLLTGSPRVLPQDSIDLPHPVTRL